MMELSMDDIRSVTDPYQAFVDSIKNSETLRKYDRNLYHFLKLVPMSLYRDTSEKIPKDNKKETLSRLFVEFAEKDSKQAQNVISAYIKEIKKKFEDEGLSPNTFSNYIKPIRKLLDANSIPIHWKTLQSLYPRSAISHDRAYAREELQKMMDIAVDLTDKVIITLGSSAGFRKESWDYFTWKDLKFFYDGDLLKGGAILIYRGDPESYWTHFTPEAGKYLLEYKELWKSQIGNYPKDDHPLLKATKTPVVRRLNSFGVKKRVEKLTRKTGMRTKLEPGKRRYDVPLMHGFRKYCNTMMRRAKVDFLDKEDIMGHSTGLEKHYERYNEEDFERFPEYQKAIPLLTISDDERIKVENVKLKEEKSDLEKKIPKMVNDAVDRIKNELIQDGWSMK
jgi:hypothetical protein